MGKIKVRVSHEFLIQQLSFPKNTEIIDIKNNGSYDIVEMTLQNDKFKVNDEEGKVPEATVIFKWDGAIKSIPHPTCEVMVDGKTVFEEEV
jgi:hypothetical protein